MVLRTEACAHAHTRSIAPVNLRTEGGLHAHNRAKIGSIKVRSVRAEAHRAPDCGSKYDLIFEQTAQCPKVTL